MKKVIYVFFTLIFSMSVFPGCKSDSDIIASFKGGNITRGDFYKWLETKHFVKDSIIKSKSKQKDRLEKMAVEIITVSKAKEEGFDKDENYQKLKELSTEPVLMKSLYDKEIKEKAHFKEPAIKVRCILLRVKDYENPEKNSKGITRLSNNEIEKKYNETMGKARELIEKINKGEKFEDLASQYSEDLSKKKGGDMGYVIRDMMPAEFSSAASALNKGEYTKEPVRTPKGVYIIKVEDSKELTETNIDKIIENKGQATRIKSGMFRNYANEYIKNLTSAPDVKFFDNKAASNNKADIVFKIGDKNYSIGDMNNRIELRQSGTGTKNTKINLTEEQKKKTAENYFRYEVLKREALQKGLDKDPEYIKAAGAQADNILAREYTNKIFNADIAVTDKDIREEYDKNKDTKYSRMLPQGKKRVKQVEPLAKARDRIERNLVNMRRSEKKKNWTAQVLQEYNFKIDESQLSGDK